MAVYIAIFYGGTHDGELRELRHPLPYFYFAEWERLTFPRPKSSLPDKPENKMTVYKLKRGHEEGHSLVYDYVGMK